MPCLQFDHEIRAAVNDLDMNKNRRLTKKFPKAYALFNWNKNPETGDPLLKFSEFPIEKSVLKDIGIPEFVDICVLDKTCKLFFSLFYPYTFQVKLIERSTLLSVPTILKSIRPMYGL